MKTNQKIATMKLPKWLKFLLFQEAHPTHKVVKSSNVISFLIIAVWGLPFALMPLALISFQQYGILGLAIFYFVVHAATIEIPHVLLDRR